MRWDENRRAAPMRVSSFIRSLSAAFIFETLVSAVAFSQGGPGDWAAFSTANKEAERSKSSLVGRQVFVTAHDTEENECLELIPQELKADLRKKLIGKSYLLFRYEVVNHDNPSFDFCIFVDRKNASLIAVEGY
jgi:hypothetical protein